MKQTATDRPFDERNKDVKNTLLLKAVTSILNVPMSIIYLFACAHVCVRAWGSNESHQVSYQLQ